MPDQEDSNARDFAAVLLDIGGGRLHALASDQLAAVTAAVKETGKKGTVLIKIEVEPLKKADSGVLTVTGTVQAKTPARDEDSPRSVFFATDAGNLSRNDPRQPQLPFREVTR